MRFPCPVPLCVFLVLTPFTSARAQAQTRPAKDAPDLRAATAQLADLARQLGATDALTTLEVWSDAAAKGMPAERIGDLRQLFKTQLVFALLGARENQRNHIRYNPTGGGTVGDVHYGAFEGEGSRPLNDFLNALRDGVRAGPQGPLTEAQRAALANAAAGALNDSVSDGAGSISQWQTNASGFSLSQKMVAKYAFTLVDSELPGDASPVGLPAPQAQMNSFGLQQVQKFKSAIGADMGLLDDWVAFDAEPPPGAAIHLPVSQANTYGWKSLEGFEQSAKSNISQDLTVLNRQSDANAIERDIQQSGGDINSPAMQAVVNLIRLADSVGTPGYAFQADMESLKFDLANGNNNGGLQDLSQRIGTREWQVLRMHQPIVAGSPGPGAN